MTLSGTTVNQARERHIPVEGNRVACQRAGTVDLDRCRECVYLLRLELVGTPASARVVCADSYVEAELHAWSPRGSRGPV
jgi:hypothetical protein